MPDLDEGDGSVIDDKRTGGNRVGVHHRGHFRRRLGHQIRGFFGVETVEGVVKMANIKWKRVGELLGVTAAAIAITTSIVGGIFNAGSADAVKKNDIDELKKGNIIRDRRIDKLEDKSERSISQLDKITQRVEDIATFWGVPQHKAHP